jgi:glyoxylase-like metal-dependent hydrolase (beta-lactamase superfamily II)
MIRIGRDVFMVGDGRRGLSHRLDCCVYLIDCGGTYLMVDSGVGLESERILENIRAVGVPLEQVRYLVVTHAHADHACGARFFQEELSVEVLAPAGEAELMAKGGDMELGLEVARGPIYPLDFKYIHCRPDRVLVDGEVVRVGERVFRVIQAPGHSPGIACLFFEDDRTLFSSDVVFHGGTIGLGNWPGCELAEYRRSIRKLSGLGVERLFPGHFLFTLRDGQAHIDRAVENLSSPWVPPAWLHSHPHR